MELLIQSGVIPLLDALQVGLYETDEHGRLTFVTRAVEDLLGYDAGELLGTVFGNLFSGAERPSSVAESGHTAHTMNATLVRKDGTYLRVRISSEIVERAGGGSLGTRGAIVPAALGEQPYEQPSTEISLTPRQLEVLRLLAAGQGTEDVARTLTIAHETVRNHIRAILQELDCHSRLEAVVVAKRLGLVP